MATHNGSRFVKEAIDSVLKQQFADYELLIVDDASTDKTREVINEFKDLRIRVIKNVDKLGLTKSLNLGLSETVGKYVARIDDDDVWSDEDKLAKQLDLMRHRPTIGVCGTQNIVINERGEELYRLSYPSDDADIRKGMLSRNLLVHSGVLVRKAALDAVGLYAENYKYAQDYELWLRIGKSWQLANLPDVYIKQRVNSKGVTSNKNMRQYVSFLKTAWLYRKDYPGFWKYTPVYGRELVINTLPKPVFYKLSRHLRPYRITGSTH